MFLLPTWFLLAVLTGVSSNTYNFLNRFILKDSDDPTVYAWYTELLRFITFSLLSVIGWKFIITPYSVSILLLLGITEFAGGYFYMKMHSYAHLSISSILSRTRLIWVPVIGFFVLHESLKLSEYAGIAIIFLGVSWIMAPKKLFIDKGAVYANLSAFIIACNVILTKLALPYTSTFVLNAAMAMPAIFLYPLLMKNAKGRMKELKQTKFKLKTLTISLSIVQLFIFTTALRFGDASKVNAIYQGMLILSVLAGIIFLKERQDIGKKLIGATITIIGVILLSVT